MDAVLRAFAIAILAGFIFGAGRLAFWLGAVWLPHGNDLPLSVQAFDVSRGDKVGKDEGKHLAALFVWEIRKIQNVMAADLSNFKNVDQVRFESVVPNTLRLKPDVPVKIDVQVKAFDLDFVGILDSLYRFFDRSDRLQAAIWINDRIKIFASFKTEINKRSIGPWMLEQQISEQAAVETFANVFVLDLYKTEVPSLNGLDAKSFAAFVSGLDRYQTYVRTRSANPASADAALKSAGDIFQKLVDDKKSSAIVYAYLGSVRSIQQQAKAAIDAYERALELNPAETFAKNEREKLLAGNALRPKVAEATAVTEAASPALLLERIGQQELSGYDATLLPAARGSIPIAVLATGISPGLAGALGPRLVNSINLLSNEPIDDHFGHGTAVASLAAALAPSANFIIIKVISETGAGDMYSIAKGIDHAIQAQAKVILLPFGAETASPPLSNIIAEAIDAGLLVIAAAGNDASEKPAFPARENGVMAIGAIDRSGKKAPFSNTGSKVLYAPGDGILVLGQSGLAKQSGTSFSAAIAAAIAADVWAARPQSTAGEIRERLGATAVETGTAIATGPIRRLDLAAAAAALMGR